MYTFLITERRLDSELEQTRYGFEDLESFLTFYRPEFNRIDSITPGYEENEPPGSPRAPGRHEHLAGRATCP